MLERYICLTRLGRSFLEVQHGTENNPTMQFDTTPSESHEQNGLSSDSFCSASKAIHVDKQEMPNDVTEM